MVNIRLRRCTGCTPRKPSSREAISHSNRAHQTPHHLSCLDPGRAQNAGPTESAPLRTTQQPEPEWLRPGRCRQPRASLRWFPAEQSRAWAVWAGRLHAPWAGAGPVWLRHCEHMPVLFVCSIPPSPQCNWTSEPKKKKKKFPPPPPLYQGRNQTLKRLANRRSYNRGNRLGSDRQ